MSDWRYHGDFSSNNGIPTVILDQNISIPRFAETLREKGFRVARALNHNPIEDVDIIAEAGKYPHSVILTMDGGFESCPIALIVPPRGKLKRNYEPLVEDLKYIFGIVDDTPSNYRHTNGNSRTQRENAYRDRVHSLRESLP
ncbi:MAG: hypothetical protein HYS62_02035 [Candidatus Aenigmarchaeota archaeon]|nr:hypothetical protein [Candidatus Aenigmarchaeota archaeon]